jgi:hypothetical protein
MEIESKLEALDIGMAELPFGVPVEIEAEVAIDA